MKRSWLILLGGLAAAAVGYACIYLPVMAGHQTIEQGPHPELAWLKREYHLSDSRFARVVELHDAYFPKCAELCKRIDKQNTKVQQLLSATNKVTPEIKQALTEAAQLRVECQSAMMQHFYEVRRAMPPDQGKRYLSWVQQETLLPGQMVPTSPGSAAEHH